MPEKGSVVLATAGRDAGGLYVVLERTEKECLLADGWIPQNEKTCAMCILQPCGWVRSNMPRTGGCDAHWQRRHIGITTQIQNEGGKRQYVQARCH